MNLIGSICLDDIPKDLLRTGKNGKRYLTIYVGQRRQTSQYGHTHFIKAYVPNDRREEGLDHFIGDLKPSEYQTQESRLVAGARSHAEFENGLRDFEGRAARQAQARQYGVRNPSVAGSADDDLPM